VPFRVVATGVDASGTFFQREFPKVFRLQSVEVRLESLSDDMIHPGGSVELSFEISNRSSSAATFGLLATDSLGRTLSLPVGSVSLDGGDSTTVTFDYALPAHADDLDDTVVVLTATDVADPDVFNSDIAELQVVTNRDPICVDPPGPAQQLWPPNHKLVELVLAELVEVTDPDGDSLVLEVDGIFQDEPVNGTGDGDTAPDAEIDPQGEFRVRAERSGGGDGRIYEVTYTASDGRGGQCSSSVVIEVPHGRRTPAIDSGHRFDSTAGS
jgi:hypothetical protein